jgi:hypothetical protein
VTNCSRLPFSSRFSVSQYSQNQITCGLYGV